MYRIKTPDDQTMIVESFPLFLVGLVVLLGSVIFVSWLLGNAELDVVGWIIVCGVLTVFLIIHRYRKTVIKKGDGIASKSSGVFGREEHDIPLSDIDRFDMMYGRGGGYARGGALVLYTTNGDSYVVIDADVNPGSAKKIKDAQSRLETFLER